MSEGDDADCFPANFTFLEQYEIGADDFKNRNSITYRRGEKMSK